MKAAGLCLLIVALAGVSNANAQHRVATGFALANPDWVVAKVRQGTAPAAAPGALPSRPVAVADDVRRAGSAGVDSAMLSVPVMVLSGIVVGALGSIAAAWVGAGVECGLGQSEWCGLGGAAAGFLAGETVMVPLGVHIVRRQGSLAAEVLLAAAVTTVFAWYADASGNYQVLLLIPPAHLISTVAMELAAGSGTPPATAVPARSR